MTDLTSLLDTYSIRARLFPALLVVAPVGVALGVMSREVVPSGGGESG